ncbi:glycerol kinase GlpK [Roseiterribacter gracilis]|uniref:Glycerol kinase n=1 Tax=Roseiterribacter gracilis TaxID=2812848 RepID=A0A8S8XBQ9_9PROT|nr:glycerol kinase 1 [Rhodospirillales bacterium TMPK1]
MAHLLALDQGTTSTRAIVFDERGAALARASRPLVQSYPAPGWVEHDPEAIWTAAREVVADVSANRRIDAIGITNQRETTVLWDRATGRAVAPAIVWQDRRTADRCIALQARGVETLIRARTGLLLDPYFSATKLGWLLDQQNFRARAERGELAFGTIDSFLLWRLTDGKVHATDATNAARTLLFDIHRNQWDDELLSLFQIPRALLPTVVDCAGPIAKTSDGIPITGCAGDQQAATVGQACWAPGTVKATYGTGCFLVVNTGDTPLMSNNRLLTTSAYRLGGKTTYALEGSIFVAGAAVQWLRDGLKLFQRADETEALARAASPSAKSVFLVPAFTGLGAPYWDPQARGALLGLTRDTGIAEIVRAALEAVCFQTRDLTDALAADGVPDLTVLRVDGGMAANDWAMQFLADLLGVPVERPVELETTAWGAAVLAGLGAGVFRDTSETERLWKLDRRFEPSMSSDERDARLAGWKDAVARVRSSIAG